LVTDPTVEKELVRELPLIILNSCAEVAAAFRKANPMCNIMKRTMFSRKHV